MTKRHKLAKIALSTPQLFSKGELLYFQIWLRERKTKKSLKKKEKEKEKEKGGWAG